MSTLEQPFFNGVSFTIMIGEVEVTLSPHQNFTNLAFERIDLSHLNLFSCSFDNCTFDDCNMVDTDWSGTNLTNCTFDNCDMTSSVMYETVLKDCKFTKCQLVEMRTYVSNFENVLLSLCNLDSTRVIETQFVHTVFEDCTINAADWRSCLITFSTLRNVRATDEPPRLSLIGITHTSLREVKLHEAEMNNCFFTKAKIIKCNFWKSSFQNPNFQNCTISHIGLNQTLISDGMFFKCPLFGCRLRFAHFDGCVFEESDIVACALAGADLSHTILCESAFIGNRLSEGGDYPTVLP
jgi:uncharacterized protein YjbI with pentapeptide repeats